MDSVIDKFTICFLPGSWFILSNNNKNVSKNSSLSGKASVFKLLNGAL